MFSALVPYAPLTWFQSRLPTQGLSGDVGFQFTNPAEILTDLPPEHTYREFGKMSYSEMNFPEILFPPPLDSMAALTVHLFQAIIEFTYTDHLESENKKLGKQMKQCHEKKNTVP